MQENLGFKNKLDKRQLATAPNQNKYYTFFLDKVRAKHLRPCTRQPKTAPILNKLTKYKARFIYSESLQNIAT